MTTTTEITNIAHYLDLTDALGDFADDYDIPALNAAYADLVNDALPDGITVTRSGIVYAEVGHMENAARNIDWRKLTNDIDYEPLLDKHQRPGVAEFYRFERMGERLANGGDV